MAPFGPPVTIPPVLARPTFVPELPGSDNTECNYLVLFFIAGVFLLSLKTRKA
jgi:hypothetical protein